MLAPTPHHMPECIQQREPIRNLPTPFAWFRRVDAMDVHLLIG